MTRTAARTAATAALTAAGLAGLLGATAQPAAAAAAPCVQRIAVINNAAYTVSFLVTDRAGITSAPTDTYPVNNFRLIDLTGTPIPEGNDVRPVITATAGDTVPAADFVSFCANGQTATYSATGTTLSPQVTLVR